MASLVKSAFRLSVKNVFRLQERIVAPDAISTSEKKFVLSKLNQVILHRLVTTELPSQMRNLKVMTCYVLFL